MLQNYLGYLATPIKPASQQKVAREGQRFSEPGNSANGAEVTLVISYLFFAPLPGARMWSRAIGPAPRKIRPKARAAKARGNSMPCSPMSPL